MPANEPLDSDYALTLTADNISRHGQCIGRLYGLQNWVTDMGYYGGK